MKLPDGPNTPPFLQTIQWISRPLEFLDDCQKRYGDVFTVRRYKHPPAVCLSNPQAIQEIFTADPELFDTGRANGMLQPLVGENALSLLDGVRYQQRRRLLMPPFHGERMRAYGQLICDISEQVMSQWSIGEPFCVRASMQEITLRVILQAVFGVNEEQRFEQLRQLLSSLMDSLDSPLISSFLYLQSLQRDLVPFSPWGHFVRQKQKIDQILIAEIQQRRVETLLATSLHPRTDILTLLLGARDEAGQPMTDAELRDELMLLLLAGYESTASALTWALYWIHQLLEVRDQLLLELGTLGSEKDPSAIARLPYLTAVCQETLRIYPFVLAALPRIVKSPFKLMGYQFDPGTRLIPCIYLTHRRPDLYPQPKRFKPERFLEKQFSPYEYLPFGGGNRRCIGLAFAQFEMKLVLAKILSRLQLMLADSHPVKPVRRGLTLTPPVGMRMVVTRRQRHTTLVQV